MEKISILLVEDEPFLAKVVKDILEQQHYAVTHANDGSKAYSLFQNNHYQLLIVDVMLPHTDGYTLVRQIRAAGSLVPVLFLTARTATPDVIEGYQSGGNDYLKKPFSLEELYLRIAELLKRYTGAPIPSGSIHQIGLYRFDPEKQLLHFPQELVIRLSYRETQLLQLLYTYRNAVLERKTALITLWGDDNFFHTRTMDVFITKLRKHLGRDPDVAILNIRGIGYKMTC